MPNLKPLEMNTYKYRNDKDYTLVIPELINVKTKLQYLTCFWGIIKIKQNYTWNGCTLAPDNEQTHLPSMVHDALYQYGKQLGLKRKVADVLFYTMLKEEQFRWSKLYYHGVRAFGWIFYKDNSDKQEITTK